MKKVINLVLIGLGTLTLISGYMNDFKRLKYLYATHFEPSTIVKDALVLEKYYNVDGNSTDLYYIEGYLKENKVKGKIMGHLPSFEKDEEGDFLVWFCDFQKIEHILIRKKSQTEPRKNLINTWFNLICILLLIPSLLYYMYSIYLEKRKKN